MAGKAAGCASALCSKLKRVKSSLELQGTVACAIHPKYFLAAFTLLAYYLQKIMTC